MKVCIMSVSVHHICWNFPTVFLLDGNTEILGSVFVCFPLTARRWEASHICVTCYSTALSEKALDKLVVL